MGKYKRWTVALVGNSGVRKTCLARRFTEFEIWDTSGHERFRLLVPGYCRQRDAVVLVYDVSSRPTFDCLQGWLREIHECDAAEFLRVLVGNKTDREDREVPTSMGEDFAARNNMYFMETSAKEGDSGEKFVMEVIRALVQIRSRRQVAKRDEEERRWKLKVIDAALNSVLFDHSLDSKLSEEGLNKLRSVHHDEHARLDPKDELLVNIPELRTLIQASVAVQVKGICDKLVTASVELFRTSESPEEKNILLQIIKARNPMEGLLKLIEQRKEKESELDKQILEANSFKYAEIQKLEEKIAKVKQSLETSIMPAELEKQKDRINRKMENLKIRSDVLSTRSPISKTEQITLQNPPEVAQITNALKEEVSQAKVQLVNENDVLSEFFRQVGNLDPDVKELLQRLRRADEAIERRKWILERIKSSEEGPKQDYFTEGFF